MVLAALALAAVVSSAHSTGPTTKEEAGASAWTETANSAAASDSPGTRFKCQAGGDLLARFDSTGPRLLMIVDAGDGPHALPIREWDGGPVRLTWSDGQRTLTWSPGVQIMWMDGSEHRMCGGGMHHEH